MNKILSVLIGMSILCAACTNTEKETPSGLKYSVLQTGDGALPKKEDIVVFDYLLRDSKDSVWSDTYSQGIPAAIPIADSVAIPNETGMFQMFRMLSKGDSVRVTMPMSEFFKDIAGAPMPPDVDSTLSMSYFIRVKDIMQMDAFRELQASLMEKKRSNQVAVDEEKITQYLTEKNISAQKDSTGLRYILHTNKGGVRPTAANCVQVNYQGALLSGEVFDAGEGAAFPLSRVIPGWQFAIPLLGVGDSATFFIPSGLAYGPEGIQGAIPPDAILVFDVALLGIGNGFDDATGTCN
jgi:FKBP-type peptidyl-prolyl cis-trans isomerase